MLDTSKIPNYESLTAEEKVQALEAYETDYSGYVKKDVFDKTASELSKLKKERTASLTEDEKQRQATDELIKSLQEDNKRLIRNEKVSQHTAEYIGLGYTPELAKETAEALCDGDISKVFANQKKFNDCYKESLKAEILKSTPKPEGGSSNTSVNFAKQLEEAQNSGDFVRYVQLTREQQQLQQNQ